MPTITHCSALPMFPFYFPQKNLKTRNFLFLDRIKTEHSREMGKSLVCQISSVFILLQLKFCRVWIANSIFDQTQFRISQNRYVIHQVHTSKYFNQKQPSRAVLRKKCFGNMQQIYRRTPMTKCDFNNVV